jgi:tetratricopeptide (TPR) repeat protein
LAALALAGSAGAGAAQERTDEARVLQRAAALEARGRYEDARQLLEELLEGVPGSSGALFSLERVLRPLDDVGAILPWADRYLTVEPRSAEGWYLKLGVLNEIDSVAALEPTVEAWITADPGSAEPYREGARLLEERHGSDRALALLGRGRAALGTEDALALEMGDALLRGGEAEGAGWSGRAPSPATGQGRRTWSVG